MKYIDDVQDLNNRKILIRTDFDVPVSSDGIIQEVFRIKRQKPMIDYLVSQGAITVMVAHISDEDVKLFNDLIPQFKKLLGHEIKYFDALNDLKGFKKLQPGFLGILHKVRDYEGEIKNDKEFAKKLAEGFDLYVNNAFAVCHRNHASVSAVTEFLPSYAGFLVEEETARLSEVVSSSKEGKILIIGGAKAETKIPVIKSFLDKAERIILGGVVANDVLKERGMQIDDSIVDENSRELLAGLNIYDERLVLADDFNAPGGKILDIGPRTIETFRYLIKKSKMVIWNGPVGIFEDERFATGTNAIAQTMAGSDAVKIIGGGDTISAVDKLGLLDKFDFVSTGGGAMLEFLAGNKLPGLEALGYYN